MTMKEYRTSPKEEAPNSAYITCLATQHTTMANGKADCPMDAVAWFTTTGQYTRGVSGRVGPSAETPCS
jgi:hypothetical protein